METAGSQQPGVCSWRLHTARSRIDNDYGYAVHLHIGVDTHAMCVRPDTRVPTLFTRDTASMIMRGVDQSLHYMLQVGRPIRGETRGSDSSHYVYFAVPHGKASEYIFVVTEADEVKPKIRSFQMRKEALAFLGEIIDVLANWRVDWIHMQIPADHL